MISCRNDAVAAVKPRQLNLRRMKAIRVYRNPHCARCARFAQAHHFLDWFGKVDPSTDTPRTGPLRMGEVVVEDLSNGQIHRGADGIELIARNTPAYFPLRLLLKVPAFRRYVSHEVSGNDCAV
jgi:hypothetical protein